MYEAIVLIGPTGAGKSPLGDLLAREGLWDRPCLHFDFGRHLRRVVAGQAPGGLLSGEEVAFLRQVLASGALLEDEHLPIARKLLLSFLSAERADVRSLLVLNGLPRHPGQAHGIADLVKVLAVVHLDCPAEVAAERIRTNAGGDRGQRRDDSEADVLNRLALFAGRSAALLAHYRAGGVRMVTVAVRADTDAAEMRRVLDARR